MSSKATERRLAENEVVFRTINESVQKGIDNINAIAKEEGVQPAVFDENEALYFYCECADEKCTTRIKIAPKVYNNLHKARNTFTIAPGHEVPRVEIVTLARKEYSVVTKIKQPPRQARTLRKTNIDNSDKP